ncbi:MULTISPECIES: two-component system response regulator SapR [Enterococcus]|jgi:DNA-binding response OmpR family regulator|uniref:DNA-binding response regulator n=1 Tax=Enterococcus dispar ATCC 51266 TaxID=1139219 RepID=S0KNW4_9ENTE|nr:response regulator transcription factor [Enterococcus dispar]EOT40876.1 DNA-binding response regulator [Enterococcus dispar ATCC 51266]EOW86751.1 DNA-binding response regulator [Enterococcus dispar ATCC 51266]MCU7357665.1 response regulator transcription factor [Enterococcus dispar]MDT2706328.1 response regulator transcription factor [Enterococcus dispar]OJG39693.1 DNA-binding response regulator [Enterococcus dispar]
MAKIMVVEDEGVIRQLIMEELKKWQFDVFGTTNFENVFDDFLEQEPQLILLDINLPVFDGYYWCQKIREVSKVPIIFISSRNTNMDMIMAMNMGADDFVTKPFELDVLVAKINALLRRSYNYSEANSETLVHNGLTLNVDNSTMMINDEVIDLSKNEYRLLYILMKNNGKILSREKLLRALWDDERYVDDNTLTVNINRLRRKIEQAGVKDYIETKVGQGYLVP